jgi:ATP phosphoribosyltransferase regulatory subunit HisZ
MTCLPTIEERQRIRKLHEEMQEQLQFGVEDLEDEAERASIASLDREEERRIEDYLEEKHSKKEDS